MPPRPPSVLILADPREVADSNPIWGSGGWLPANDRMALDWLTLCRLLGLDVEVVPTSGFRAERLDSATRWLVLGCDSAVVGPGTVSELRTATGRQPLVLLGRATGPGQPLADWLGIHSTPDTACGHRLSAIGGHTISCAKPLTLPRLHCHTGATTVARLDDCPIAIETTAGMGKAVMTAFDASELRDHDGAGGALLIRLLSACAMQAHATLYWQGLLIPRMDDPGSSEALHHRIYDHASLGREAWQCIAAVLRRHRARISVGYVSGWVDSGETMPGRLLLDGNEAARMAGNVHPSPRVCFERHAGDRIIRYDHRAEYQALQDLRREALLEVEMHGHTHVFPDRMTWLVAPDRFDNRDWFREFGAAAASYLDLHPEVPHPVDEALASFRDYFDRIPSTLICPGEVFTRRVLEKALERGLMQVSSYYLAFRHHERLCWTQHVCAPYLDQSDAAWFSSGLPVVGCFHDFDIARHGVDWLAGCLDGWIAAGCRRICGLDDLNSLLQLRMELLETPQGWQVHLQSDPAWRLPSSFEILLHFPGRAVPVSVAAFIDGKTVAAAELSRYSDEASLLEITC